MCNLKERKIQLHQRRENAQSKGHRHVQSEKDGRKGPTGRAPACAVPMGEKKKKKKKKMKIETEL